MDATAAWNRVCEGVWRYQDSCALYAVGSEVGWVLINAGTGEGVAALASVKPLPIRALMLTHHFRDHTAGTARWRDAGAEVWAPYWEQEYLRDPAQHWTERQIWNSYDNRWDRMAPRDPVPVDRFLLDYDRFSIGGLDFEVVPTPAHTNGAVSLIIRGHGQTFAAVGELICGPGKTGRVAPLQYDYNDLKGGFNLHRSLDRVLAHRPDLVLPSLGQPFGDVPGAFAALQANIESLTGVMADLRMSLAHTPKECTLHEFQPNCFFVRGSVASTHLIRTPTGKTVTIDYGYGPMMQMPAKSHRGNRRAILLARPELIDHFGTDRIDLALVSHFHDDHVNGLPLLQRLYGTEVWAGENFADVLERPERYDLPCLWHEPIHVARRCPLGETMEWEGLAVRLFPLSGHTRYANLVVVEVGGVTLAHTGDQIFFHNPDNPNGEAGPDSSWFSNHVYKNGLELGCYFDTIRLLEEVNPDWLLTGHTAPYRMNDHVLRVLRDGAEQWERAHRALMPLGDEDSHAGAECQVAKLYPYRNYLDQPGPLAFDADILNPFPRAIKGEACLGAPEGWKTQPVPFAAGPRERVRVSLTLEPPADACCRRCPVTLGVQIEGRPLGEVTEALVSIGTERPWRGWDA